MLICQSCGMNISSDEHKGVNSNGSLSYEYCAYCYKDGKFNNNLTLEEYVEIGLEYSPEYQKAKTEAEREIIREQTREYLSKLKRWK
ncbi:zinc ribbon domain-containing protein [Anaerosphaera multitolerans]|uniref:Transcriptional regulator n=1 Tax=Anaerosphaera multitolerans TaxID=2487351 RepID=A0A437S9I7_9FIRM|nr:zinc ribbon domain-containing protein [Anaerosphaera multitolerans]RVU55478.1 transcriptional regulator [Anaerosphaera multitolerans]